MIINALDNFEIPDSLIEEWGETDSDDIRYVEKQAIDYIRANTGFEGGIAAIWTGEHLLFSFGSGLEYLESEGFYLG